MMPLNNREFQEWMKETGYSNINDWNMQEIDGELHYFIKNSETGKYALIKEFFPYEYYTVLIEGWTDYNEIDSRYQTWPSNKFLFENIIRRGFFLSIDLILRKQKHT